MIPVHKEELMPVAFIQEFAIDEGGDRDTANYDEVSQRLNTDADAPAGLIVHCAGFDEQAGVFRIFNVWETEEDGRRFEAERVMPIVLELVAAGRGGSMPMRESYYDLHRAVR
jgi:hypothetical protein